MQNSKIEWTDHTFNPWIGCQKVSAGCDHCYAEAMMDHRYHRVEWGPHGERQRTSEANWRTPLAWNRKAEKEGTRPRVFCASLADVWDNKVPAQWRADLFQLIARTTQLDWLLLTKRPENISRLLPCAIEGLRPWPWGNVWLGATAEDQACFDRRWAVLREIPAAVHFVSYEPALGPLVLPSSGPLPGWIICGGETGVGARIMKRRWARELMADCEERDVAYFMKQMTDRAPIPEDLLVREFPEAQAQVKATPNRRKWKPKEKFFRQL